MLRGVLLFGRRFRSRKELRGNCRREKMPGERASLQRVIPCAPLRLDVVDSKPLRTQYRYYRSYLSSRRGGERNSLNRPCWNVSRSREDDESGSQVRRILS